MKELIFQGKRCVLSRKRNGDIELVGEDGEVLVKPKILQEWKTVEKHSQVVPSIIPFALRPRSFLTELRSRRDVDLGKRVRAKREAKAKDTQPKQKRSSLKSEALTAAASLPFDLVSILKKKGKKDAKV